MRKTKKIYTIDEIRALSYDILKKYKIEKAYVFGSYSRNEATANSDIDIMIKVGKTKFTLITLSKLEDELGEVLKKEIDLITEEPYTEQIKFDNSSMKEAKRRFFKEVKSDRKLIYG